MDKILKPYVSLLSRYREKVNLTGVRGEDGISAIVEDSRLDLEAGLEVLDLGSGGGIPGLPLKIMNPGINISFMDKNRKKMNILKMMMLSLGVDYREILTGMAQTFYDTHGGKFDVVVSRGVGETPFVMKLARPFLKSGGTLYLWKPKGYRPDDTETGRAVTCIIPGKNCDIISFTFED